jgi:hypothetical protein
MREFLPVSFGKACSGVGMVTVTVTWFRVYLNTPLGARVAHGAHLFSFLQLQVDLPRAEN